MYITLYVIGSLLVIAGGIGYTLVVKRAKPSDVESALVHPPGE